MKNNTLMGILVVIVIILGAYTIMQRRAVAPSQNDPIVSTTAGQQQPSLPVSHCGLTVNSPLAGSTVSFPLSVSATVDNTQSQSLGCSWTVFEAQAGSVTVKDANGNVLGQSYLKTTGNWMTTGPVVFTATIATLTNPSYTGPLTIVFEEEDVSGQGNPDTLSVNVMK